MYIHAGRILTQQALFEVNYYRTKFFHITNSCLPKKKKDPQVTG